MTAGHHARKAGGAAWLLAVVILAAGVARADDLPPGFKADPNDPFKDAEGGVASGAQGGAPHFNQAPNYGNGMPPGQGFNTYPNGVESNFPPADSFALPAVVDGEPITPSMSANTALSYIDLQLKKRSKTYSGSARQSGLEIFVTPASADIPFGLAEAMEPIVAKFGVTNLIEADRLGSLPRWGEGPELDSWVKGKEDSIILGALALAATDSDVSALMDAIKDPGIFGLLLKMEKGKENSALDDMVMEKVDRDAKEPISDNNLIAYALQSPNAGLQTELAAMLERWIDTTDPNPFMESHPLLDEVMGECMTAPSGPCQDLFPKWATLKTKMFQPSQSSESSQSMPAQSVLPFYHSFLRSLSQDLEDHPKALVQMPVREGLQTLIDDIDGKPGFEIEHDFLAAEMGDAQAFPEFMQLYAQLPPPRIYVNGRLVNGTAEDQSQATGASSHFGGQNMNQGSQIMLNGSPVTDQAYLRELGVSLVKNVTYFGTGNKTKGIVAHLDHAAYANGAWTVTDPSFAAAQQTAAATDVPSAFPSAPAPPPTTTSTPPAPSTDVPSAFPSMPAPAAGTPPATKSPAPAPTVVMGPTSPAP